MRTLMIVPACFCAAPALALAHDGDCLHRVADIVAVEAEVAVPAGTALSAQHASGGERGLQRWETPIFPHEAMPAGRRQDFPEQTATFAALDGKGRAADEAARVAAN